jgi:hypothetical protein
MTFRQVADCLPEDLKKRFASSRVDENTAYSVHAFRDDTEQADVVIGGISGLEALGTLRDVIADPQVISGYATRERGDGTAQILYLCELEERFQPAE